MAEPRTEEMRKGAAPGAGASGPRATLEFEGKSYSLPVVEGTEGERAVDITRLRQDSGLITLDSGYGNTGACRSAICFIDGEKGMVG
jgi:citrate synthase